MIELDRDNELAAEPSWLLASKASPPPPAASYFRREDLLGRLEPLPRLTVIRAPGGFGKTSLLADVCHQWRAADRIAAWLTLDEDDTPGIIDAYLAFAFKLAGLEMVGAEAPTGNLGGAALPHRTRRRTEFLVAAIEAHGPPCMLVLDDVDRVASRQALDTINFLIHNGPRNLCIAIAGRENPGLDVANAILDGHGLYLTVDQLRFSKPWIARFFGGALSRRELSLLAERTDGWPVALRVYRNMRNVGAPSGKPASVQELSGDSGVAAEWFSERLLRGLERDDRDLLLDLSLFEWIAPESANEVLHADVHRRIGSLNALEGLWSIDEDTNVLRLNPLLKEYCATRRFREDPARFREVHRRLADVQARAGHVLSAFRHTSEVADAQLIGEVLERVGGVRQWGSFGVKGLVAIDGFLTTEVVELFPRAALVRCTALALASRLGEALALYAKVSAATQGFMVDRAGGDSQALQADHLLVQATLVGYSCQPLNSALTQQALAGIEKRLPHENDRIVTGAYRLAVSHVDHQRAHFDAAGRDGVGAREDFLQAGASYGATYANLHLGTVAMAQGHIDEAARCYRLAGPNLIADILSFELEHERTVGVPLKPKPDVSRVAGAGWIDVYAAAYSVRTELAFEAGGAQAALLAVDESRQVALASNLTTVLRFLAALRVAWLVRDGLADEAERAWRLAKLPDEDAALLDLDGQSWREMEALACARIGFLVTQFEFGRALELAQALRDLASSRGLARVLMNGIAFSMMIAYRARDTAAATELLAEFFRRTKKVPYFQPLARVGEATREVIRLLVARDGEDAVPKAARGLLVDGAALPEAPQFTPRERAIMEGVASGRRNKEIANHLGLTEHGVRYHLKNIYRKTGAQGRVAIAQLVSRRGR